MSDPGPQTPEEQKNDDDWWRAALECHRQRAIWETISRAALWRYVLYGVWS